jgi:hypothetical protein
VKRIVMREQLEGLSHRSPVQQPVPRDGDVAEHL